jgi:hypothetical protein
MLGPALAANTTKGWPEQGPDTLPGSRQGDAVAAALMVERYEEVSQPDLSPTFVPV